MGVIVLCHQLPTCYKDFEVCLGDKEDDPIDDKSSRLKD